MACLEAASAFDWPRDLITFEVMEYEPYETYGFKFLSGLVQFMISI